MLKITPTDDSLIVIILSGEITGQDVDRVYDLMIEKLNSGGKTSLYLELQGHFDMEGAALWRDTARAPDILGKLKQFDRIAFVASQRWMRGIAKVEGALLSLTKIEMEVYDEGEADYALAWVKREVDERHTGSLREISTGSPEIVGFEIEGKIRKADLTQMSIIVEKMKQGKIPKRAIAFIRYFKGADLSVFAHSDFLKMKKEAIDSLDRYAIVGAPGWIETMLETVNPLFNMEMKSFDADEEDAAWAWIKENVPD
ncbi:MAG: hypothetical protein COA41_17815 [Sphingopyxis sp.]|nr:MAG: hypothetical protein COA41_17815 [Sphingopyxis sp.]